MKKGFTLAEVLITLGIIGIVAALTMPSLIVNYQKKQTAVRLEKAYAELTQAVKLSEVDNGYVDDWDYTIGGKEFYDKYLKDYFKNVSFMPASEYMTSLTYKNLNGSNANNSIIFNDTYAFMLANGTILYLPVVAGNFQVIYVDINGFAGPNIFGKDMFLLNIQPKYGVTPYGFGDVYTGSTTVDTSFGFEYDRDAIKNLCTKTSSGLYCAALIIVDGWEIKDDYPW